MTASRYYNGAMLLIYALLIFMPQWRYLSLNGCLFDLGVLDGMISHAITTPTRMLMGHIHPVGWLYGVISIAMGDFTPQALLALQSAALIFCIHWISISTNRLTALLFALHPAVWWQAINGFHFDHVAVIAMVFFYHFYLRQAYSKAILAALCTLLAKETFSLFVISAGLLLLLTPWHRGGKKSLIYGMLALVIGAGYFLFATRYFLPLTYEAGATQMQSPAFAWLGGSISEMMMTLITRPGYVLSGIVGEPRRLLFFAVLLGGFAFTLWRGIWFLIPVLPLLLIPALSKNGLYYGYGDQYMAPLAVACAYGFYVTYPRLKRFSPRWAAPFVIACALFIHVIFSPSILSRTFLSERQSAFNYHNYITDERSATIKQSLIDHADLFASKIVSTQNSVYYYPMRYAERLLPFPQGIATPHPFFTLHWDNEQNRITSEETRRYADVVVVDMKRAKFMVDKGCQFNYGKCADAEVEQAFDAAFAALQPYYKTVYAYDGFFILAKL